MKKTEIKLTEIDIEAGTEQTSIYSDGSDHIDESRGACATIVSLEKNIMFRLEHYGASRGRTLIRPN